MTKYNKVNPKQSFPELEEQILGFEKFIKLVVIKKQPT